MTDSTIISSAISTIFTLKLSLLKILATSSPIDSLKTLATLWPSHSQGERKNNLMRTAELIYFLKAVLQESGDREELSLAAFDQSYYQTISKIDLIAELLLREIATAPTANPDIPKWKGKSMQFIELISIGIELDLFEGQNQNQICNSLLKAFQVEAESDQPIYKQRFNALFKRSKIHLPLIADYINRVEEAKKMKILFTVD